MTGDRSQTRFNRVLRGGSWINNGRNARSANRNRNTADNRNNNIGFRLVQAQDVIGIGITDQIVIPPEQTILSKKQGHRYVSNKSSSLVNACRVAVLNHQEAP